MPDSVFITGASGFIGKPLLKRRDSKKFKALYCLSRRTPRTIQAPVSDNVHIIQEVFMMQMSMLPLRTCSAASRLQTN
jgi:hypothetical protein